MHGKAMKGNPQDFQKKYEIPYQSGGGRH